MPNINKNSILERFICMGVNCMVLLSLLLKLPCFKVKKYSEGAENFDLNMVYS